ncbi:unnamed protein product [marine sediment metagenome]|uniref:Uncharacterized protein n=1 Tax=marine sediment metagenome TaxID=412755 RepID=X1KV04_9ZZZZ
MVFVTKKGVGVTVEAGELNIACIDANGKLKDLTSTNLANLDGSALTGISAGTETETMGTRTQIETDVSADDINIATQYDLTPMTQITDVLVHDYGNITIDVPIGGNVEKRINYSIQYKHSANSKTRCKIYEGGVVKATGEYEGADTNWKDHAGNYVTTNSGAQNISVYLWNNSASINGSVQNMIINQFQRYTKILVANP